MDQPILIACAHGTDDPQGQAEINRLRSQLAQLRPGLEVHEAYVDVQAPALAEVLARLPAGRQAVVVPLLLSPGYHLEVDIPRAISTRPGTTAAAPLGPDPRLAGLLRQRLQQLPGFGPDWAVVLAAAGSSRPSAAAAVEATAEWLRELIPQPVAVAYGAGALPRPATAVERLRTVERLRSVENLRGAEGRQQRSKVAVASYLLAPGFFQQRLASAGADALSAPLLPEPLIAQIALERYDAALV